MRVCGRLCDRGEVVTVTLSDGRILGIEPGEAQADVGGPDHWLAPGFLDLQLNGYGGHDFNRGAWADPDEVSTRLAPIFDLAARAGTALFCPTITTNGHEAIVAGLRTLDRALSASPTLAAAAPAIHLEGPYLSPEDGPRGAHPLEHIRPPDWDEFRRFQEAAGGRIRLVTVAPEVPGGLRFIERLAEAGLVAALGHTGASPETIRDAVRAGARMSTHLGNGAHGTLPRHPNYLWEQLAADELCASVIADGHHLPASVLKCIARVKGPERLILVSDAVSLGGLDPGLYGDGRFEVLRSGKIVLAGTPYLAGAGHLLDTGVAHAVRTTGLTLGEVIRTVTANPARLLGLERRKGRVEVGYDADLTLFQLPAEGPLRITATVRAGGLVHHHTPHPEEQGATA